MSRPCQGYGYFNPIQINTLLDNAVGAPGYYGAFLANMHTDNPAHAGSETIINAALAQRRTGRIWQADGDLAGWAQCFLLWVYILE